MAETTYTPAQDILNDIANASTESELQKVGNRMLNESFNEKHEEMFAAYQSRIRSALGRGGYLSDLQGKVVNKLAEEARNSIV